MYVINPIGVTSKILENVGNTRDYRVCEEDVGNVEWWKIGDFEGFRYLCFPIVYPSGRAMGKQNKENVRYDYNKYSI